MPPTAEQGCAARRLLDDLRQSHPQKCWYFEHIKDLPATAAILGAGAATQLVVVLECVNRIALMKHWPRQYDLMNVIHEAGYPWEANLMLSRLLRRKLPWTSEYLAYVVNRVADLEEVCLFSLPFLPSLVNVVQRELRSCPTTEKLRQGLVRLESAIVRRYRAAEKKLCEQLRALADSPAEQPQV